MRIETLPVGLLGANCHLVAADGSADCVIIDPGGDPERIDARLRQLGLRAGRILLTHAHYDHIGGAAELRTLHPGAEIACHASCASRALSGRQNLSFLIDGVARPGPTTDRMLADGEAFEAAGLFWTARLVEGHAAGHLVYLVSEAEGAPPSAAFTGDAVFAGSIGRTDVPEGDAELLVSGLLRLLAELRPETALYPGHGPATTAGEELRSNPFL